MWEHPPDCHGEAGLEGQQQKASEGTETGPGRDEGGLAWSRVGEGCFFLPAVGELGQPAVRGPGPVHLSTKCHSVKWTQLSLARLWFLNKL